MVSRIDLVYEILKHRALSTFGTGYASQTSSLLPGNQPMYAIFRNGLQKQNWPVSLCKTPLEPMRYKESQT